MKNKSRKAAGRVRTGSTCSTENAARRRLFAGRALKMLLVGAPKPRLIRSEPATGRPGEIGPPPGSAVWVDGPVWQA